MSDSFIFVRVPAEGSTPENPLPDDIIIVRVPAKYNLGKKAGTESAARPGNKTGKKAGKKAGKKVGSKNFGKPKIDSEPQSQYVKDVHSRCVELFEAKDRAAKAKKVKVAEKAVEAEVAETGEVDAKVTETKVTVDETDAVQETEDYEELQVSEVVETGPAKVTPEPEQVVVDFNGESPLVAIPGIPGTDSEEATGNGPAEIAEGPITGEEGLVYTAVETSEPAVQTEEDSEQAEVGTGNFGTVENCEIPISASPTHSTPIPFVVVAPASSPVSIVSASVSASTLAATRPSSDSTTVPSDVAKIPADDGISQSVLEFSSQVASPVAAFNAAEVSLSADSFAQLVVEEKKKPRITWFWRRKIQTSVTSKDLTPRWSVWEWISRVSALPSSKLSSWREKHWSRTYWSRFASAFK